jgi:hypothetical protein
MHAMKASNHTDERSLTTLVSDDTLRSWLELILPKHRRDAVHERLVTLFPSVLPVSTPARGARSVRENSTPYEARWTLPLQHLRDFTTTTGSSNQAATLHEIDLRWPADAAPRDVVDWLTQHAPERAHADRLCTLVRRNFGFEPVDASDDPVSPETDPLLFVQCSVAARAFVVWQAIERDLQKPMIAVDASQPHHDLISGWRDLPKNIGRRNEQRFRRKLQPAQGQVERLEVLAPDGRSIQLTLALDSDRGFHHAIVETLRQWQGPEGIRHWAAMQRLFSVEGGRTGSVRWTLEAHLDALGYEDRRRRDPAVRRRVANQIETLTKLELAVYAADGKLRARQPLIAVTTKYDALRGSEWALEGMELRVNEWIYRGVRDPETGEIGSYWYPAPITLAQIDHGKYPYAIALGLILPMRWRWDMGKRAFCTLKGSSLLSTAGIKYSPHDPGRTWKTLERNLHELQRRGGLERYEWEGTPWSNDGICKLYPPQSARDRTVHGLRPIELPPAPSILTGGELAAWRKQRGWSQVEAATVLNVGVATLKRAEVAATEPLGRTLRKAIDDFFKQEKTESQPG